VTIEEGEELQAEGTARAKPWKEEEGCHSGGRVRRPVWWVGDKRSGRVAILFPKEQGLARVRESLRRG
jgi:hypothetical protein